MGSVEIIHLVWELFGVAIDYKTGREDVIALVRRLAN